MIMYMAFGLMAMSVIEMMLFTVTGTTLLAAINISIHYKIGDAEVNSASKVIYSFYYLIYPVTVVIILKQLSKFK